MKHFDMIRLGYPILNTREAYRREHGERVEERQRVNGQQNGYRAISEAELQAQRVTANTYKPVHGGYPTV